MKATIFNGFKGIWRSLYAFVNSLLLYTLYTFVVSISVMSVVWGLLLLFNAQSSLVSLFTRIGLTIGTTVAVIIAVGEADKAPNGGNTESQRYVSMTAWLSLIIAIWT